ncbi:MAG: AAA family ATPase, partial [Burkholderiales bacterium]
KRLMIDSIASMDSFEEKEPWTLSKNIGFLAESLRLSEVERAILSFVAVARESAPLRVLLGGFNAATLHTAAEWLACALEQSFDQVQKALQTSGTLTQLGLIAEIGTVGDFEDFCSNATNSRLYAALHQSHDNAHAFLGSFLIAAAPARIERENVQHLGPFLDLAMRLLTNSLSRHEPGINILLHGAPGTGKTEFARVIARELGIHLYEISGDDESGTSGHPSERYAALLLASRALQGRDDAMLLFDEAEDAFPVRWFHLAESKSHYTKSWMTRLLETLPVPVIWISNVIDHMDPAYLRRFTLHVRFRELPRSVKRRLAEQYFGGAVVNEELKQEIARLPALTPGQLETASRVLRLYHPEGQDQAGDVVRLQLRAHREAVGLSYQGGGIDLAIPYQPDYINLREPMTLPALLCGLRAHPRAAFCFYGVPGTGKTQLVHHLADQLGRELIYRSASDLLSKWVGQTEKLIAEMFAEAEDRKNDVLILLDEADTFLSDRTLAHASWERSHTNEFLARMERFSGLFICTTNLVDTLDPAVLRRFQFRVEFLPMRCQQVLAAFRATFQRTPSADEQRQLNDLDGLVPADFANVARQLKFFEGRENGNATKLLKAELAARRGLMPRPIGFTSQVGKSQDTRRLE